MALPRVNEVLKFSLTIPSTGQVVKYRPYLVKEEKVLLQAFESQDMKASLQAMCDTIEACLDDDVNVSQLPTFDLEYMFIKMRGKSVGESSDILIRCKSEECAHQNQFTIDLEDVDVGKDLPDNMIDITETIIVEMQYPSYSMMMEQGIETLESETVDTVFDILCGCIAAVHTSDERIDCREQTKEEVVEFLNSMTATQLKKLSDFLQQMPSVQYQANFACQKCGETNELLLKGLSDFF